MLFVVVVAYIIRHYHYTATQSSLLRGEPKLFKMLVLQVVDNSNEKKKILFQLLGCPRNFVDTEVMLGIFLENVVFAACNNDVFFSIRIISLTFYVLLRQLTTPSFNEISWGLNFNARWQERRLLDGLNHYCDDRNLM